MFWGVNRESSTYTTSDYYKLYKTKSSNPVSPSVFNSVIVDFFEIRMQLLIFENMDIHFPFRFGSVGIRGICDAIKLKKDGTVRYLIDWGKTNKLWASLYPDKTPAEIKQIKNKPVIYFTNNETDGRVYDFIWDKLTSNFRYKTYYRFSPTRKWKRKLANYIRITKNIPYYDKA